MARCDHEIVGYAYGFVGERGQPWSDRVAAALPEEVATTWVGGHFELADLAVLESHRRHGGGRRLHDVLMDGETRPALLATDDADTAAVRLLTSRGWQRLGLLLRGRPGDGAAADGVRSSARHVGAGVRTVRPTMPPRPAAASRRPGRQVNDAAPASAPGQRRSG